MKIQTKQKKVRKVNALKIFSIDSTYGSMLPSSSLMIEPQQTQYGMLSMILKYKKIIKLNVIFLVKRKGKKMKPRCL